MNFHMQRVHSHFCAVLMVFALVGHGAAIEKNTSKKVNYVMVVTAPTAYRITLAILSALVIIIAIAFIVTEKKKKQDDGKKLPFIVTEKKKKPEDYDSDDEEEEAEPTIDPNVKDVIMAMYAMAVFGVVAYNGQLFLSYPAGTSQFGLALVHMMCGNVVGGVRWTMQCFTACASYLQCKEPFSLMRVIILCIVYFAYQWPIEPIITVWAVFVSNEPSSAWYVMTDKRWFVGVIIFCYCAFAYMRQFAFREEAEANKKTYIPASVQCGFWVVLFIILNIWPVDDSVVANIMPGLVSYWFQDILVCGLFVWVGCIMMYFIVGYYGRDFVERCLAHPLAHDHRFQSGLRRSAPVIFFVALFAQFYGPQQSIGIDLERSGNSWKWDPVTVILDQIVAVGMIVGLSQCVRCYSGWVKTLGACSLGIYLGGGIIFFLPHGSDDKLGGSFGVIINQYEVLPTMQRMVNWSAGFWPAMVLTVFVYTCLQIFVFGLLFHFQYLKFIRFMDNIFSKLKLKGGRR